MQVLSQAARSGLKQVPRLLQGMGGVSKVEVSLATGVVTLDVIAEDPMDVASVQVSPRAAALLLLLDSVHAMA